MPVEEQAVVALDATGQQTFRTQVAAQYLLGLSNGPQVQVRELQFDTGEYTLLET